MKGSSPAEAIKLIIQREIATGQSIQHLPKSRVFPRPFTHGGDLSPPPPICGGTSAGGQSVNRGDS